MQMSLFDGSQPFRIDKPIRLIELFAGIGSQAKALKNLGANFEHYRICEFDKYAVQSYNAVHGTNFETSDITKITADDLGIVDTDKYCYIMTYSFPCFTQDSLVLTDKGYKKIIDIKVGDFVLTHDNTYKKVVNTFDNGKHRVYSIKGMCIDEIKATENHKFYVREMYRKGHNRVRNFKEPKWEELRNINKNHYFGVAINNKNVSIANGKLPYTDNNFWWIIGRYIGDGWIRQQGGIIICCNENEILEISSRLIMLGFKYSIIKEKTVYKIHIAKKALSNFCEQFGKGASNKHLTNFILDLPTYYLKDFLVGYLSADGCFTNGVYKATTTSRELVYGIAQCVAKVYKTPYRVYKVNAKPKKVIDGREVNQKDWYQLVFKVEKRKQDKAFYENGYIWYPIKEITKIGVENVYDIEVEDNHSFTVQNTIVHNCQDLSNAGLGKGMAKGSGTRSGLLWEVERLLDECKDLPQVLVMENVPAVIGAKNIQHFAKWQEKLESLGYKNKWEVLNAKDFGIPQNRERCFMVSLLGDYYYEFPKTIPLKLRLKDMLEKEVDEKYYLSSTGVDYFAKKIDTFNDKRSDYIQPYVVSNNHGTFTGEINDCNIHPTLTTDTSPAWKQVLLEEQNFSNKPNEPIVYDDYNGRVRADQSCIGTLTTNCGNDAERNGVKIIEPCKYELSEKMKRYINSYDDSYKVSDGNLVVNRDIAVAKTTREGSTRADASDYISAEIEPNKNIAKMDCTQFRIRKLTPKECWRLMGFADEDVDNATYIKKNYKIEDLFDKEKYKKCFVKSTGAIEKPLQKNMVAYALNITSVLADMGITSIKWKKFQNKQDYENSNLVNIAITPLAKLAQGECATSITKCLLYTETLYGLIKELDQHRTAIIELENEGKQNTAKYMRISLEENLTSMKLYIILTVLRQIIESKIYISTLQRVNIHGRIANCENYEKNMEIALLSNFEMECIYTRISSSQLYKQAGNSIVVNVLMAIFKQML